MHLPAFNSASLNDHDLSLLIDKDGRLWRFHPVDAHGRAHPRIDAHLAGADVVITVEEEQVLPRDVHVSVHDHVMDISTDGDGRPAHLADVLLPEQAEDQQIRIGTQASGFELLIPVHDLHPPIQ